MESEESDGKNGIMLILCRLTRLSKNHFAIELLNLFIEFKARALVLSQCPEQS